MPAQEGTQPELNNGKPGTLDVALGRVASQTITLEDYQRGNSVVQPGVDRGAKTDFDPRDPINAPSYNASTMVTERFTTPARHPYTGKKLDDWQ